jgi:tripartite-type tricarboxylate transporter receptor subunit TctC
MSSNTQFRGLCFSLMMPAALAAMDFGCAIAADWMPDRRIEIVVPSAAGSGNDRLARLIHRIAQDAKENKVQTSSSRSPIR